MARKDFHVVAKVAIKGIEALDPNSKYSSKIEELKDYWKIKNQIIQRSKAIKKNGWLEKKSKMKNLERLRQRLKTPLYGGKWL